MVQFPVVARERPRARLRAATAGLLGRRRAPAALRSYDLFLVNSEFTRGWTRRRLGVEATVLAPPVDPPPRAAVGAPGGERGREILSVGRFFRGRARQAPGRADQRVSPAARARLGASPRGRSRRTAADPGAAGRAARAGRRPPRPLPRQRVGRRAGERHARASLFWHAAGYGVDPARAPERLEHFGIATAEAMLCGAVPLVFPGGGQAEVVQDGVTGVHWRTPPELAARHAGADRRPRAGRHAARGRRGARAALGPRALRRGGRGSWCSRRTSAERSSGHFASLEQG